MTAAKAGHPVRVHMIVIGDMIINDISVDLDTAQLLVTSLIDLLGRTIPVDPNGG